MFSCPTDDIHSIYLDNELSEEFIGQYESHISTCPSCRKKLGRLKKVHEVLQADSKSLAMDAVYMQQCYGRLMTKMRYSKASNASRENPMPRIITYMAPIAAALVLAVILPVGLGAKKAFQDTQSVVSKITPVERPQDPSFSNKNIVINGNINDNLAQSVHFGNVGNPRFADVDVFRPEFGTRIVFYGSIDASDFGYFGLGKLSPRSSAQGSFPFPVAEMQGYQSE